MGGQMRQHKMCMSEQEKVGRLIVALSLIDFGLFVTSVQALQDFSCIVLL